MCARRFLIVIFWLTLLVAAGAFAIFQFGERVLVKSATPKGEFVAPPPRSGPDYTLPANWIARPDMDAERNPAEWRPADYPPPTLGVKTVSTFFVHPTTYLQRDRWNALLDEPQSRARAELFVRSQASAFNNASVVWAPRYRQAAYGAFLLKDDDAKQALDLAYSDVVAAFDRFLEEIPDSQAIIIAGHSQGALHVSRLLAERGAALKGRLVAAYVVGWPLSTTADLPAMGLAACTAPDQTGCVLSWQSFGDPGNPSLILDAWQGTKGPSGIERKREDMLCVNPISGTQGGAAAPAENPGTLIPSADLASATIAPGRVGARCDEGFLIINGDIPALGPFVLPGNNYHVYDYALFWSAIARDAGRRVQRWAAR